MLESPAKVSIGLPVYNGATFLALAIDSLLTQTYLNFELIISDNCSTDGTADICRDYVPRDSRIRFYQNQTNIGAAANFNRVFELSSGKYFMWAAHDDLWDADYINKCVAVLDRYPSVVLCASDIRFIDQQGKKVVGRGMRVVGGKYNRLNTFRMDLPRRVRELTREVNWYAIYGVMKADALKKTKLFREIYGTDVILLMELLLQGETLILPEALFYYRVQRKSAADQLRDVTGQEAQKPTVSPYTDLAKNLLSVIEKATLSEKIKNQLINDLVENVSWRNRRWQRLIIKENPSTKSSGRLEQVRKVRHLVAPASMDHKPTGRLRESVNDMLNQLGEISAHIRRTLGKFKNL